MDKPNLIDRIKVSWNFWSSFHDLMIVPEATGKKMSDMDRVIHLGGKYLVTPALLMPVTVLGQYFDSGDRAYEKLVDESPRNKWPGYFA